MTHCCCPTCWPALCYLLEPGSCIVHLSWEFYPWLQSPSQTSLQVVHNTRSLSEANLFIINARVRLLTDWQWIVLNILWAPIFCESVNSIEYSGTPPLSPFGKGTEIEREGLPCCHLVRRRGDAMTEIVEPLHHIPAQHVWSPCYKISPTVQVVCWSGCKYLLMFDHVNREQIHIIIIISIISHARRVLHSTVDDWFIWCPTICLSSCFLQLTRSKGERFLFYVWTQKVHLGAGCRNHFVWVFFTMGAPRNLSTIPSSSLLQMIAR